MKLNVDVSASLKRIAWAYGCSKAGSEEERELYKLLCTKMLAEILTHELQHDGEATTRERVLREQAIRARLAKCDMGPEGRLRTLREADEAGIDLDERQRGELKRLTRTAR